jgi:hypothetical protein
VVIAIAPRGALATLTFRAQRQKPPAVNPKDALLFELLELTVLAFPRPPRAVELFFEPNNAGDAPALTDLRARPHEGAPERPDLGYTDEEIMDGMNATLADLLTVIGFERGAPVISGKLTLVDDLASGGVIATTIGDDNSVVHRRHIDKSERTESVHTAALFTLLAARLDDEVTLRERSRVLSVSGARYSLDTENATVTVRIGDDEKTYGAHAIATWHAGESSLSWAWANEPLPESLRARVDEIRRAVTTPGLAAFTREELTVPEKMAMRLIGNAAVRMGADLLLVVTAEGPEGAVLELSLALTDPRAA